METPEQTDYPDATEVFAEMVGEAEEVEALMSDYPQEFPEGTQVNYVSEFEFLNAKLEGIKAVFAAALAQVLGGDPLMARNIFTKLNEDVDNQTHLYLQMVVEAREENNEEDTGDSAGDGSGQSD